MAVNKSKKLRISINGEIRKDKTRCLIEISANHYYGNDEYIIESGTKLNFEIICLL